MNTKPTPTLAAVDQQRFVRLRAVKLTVQEWEVFENMLAMSVNEVTDVDYPALQSIQDKFIEARRKPNDQRQQLPPTTCSSS